MTTLTFDTLKFANRLKAAGVPDKQAEAETEALAEVMTEAINTSDLATKRDIQDSQATTKQEIQDNLATTRQEMHASEIRIIKWVVAMAIAQMVFVVGLIMRLPH